MKSHYDAIVTGAGSVGVPTTYFLAQEGYKVLCIEKQYSAGQGENKSAIGGTRATHSDPAKIKICQKSLDIFSKWEQKHGKDIGWMKGGYCFPVYREEEEKILKNILPIQKKFELNIDWCEPEKIKNVVPGINPSRLRGGTFSPDDGQVSPLMFIDAIEEASREGGAGFNYNEKVINLIIKKNKVIGVKTDKGEYFSDVVVNAAGAYAKEICDFSGLDIPIFPESHEAGITAPVKRFLEPLVVDLRPGIDRKTANFYFGQNSEKAIIFCYTPKPNIPGVDRRCTSEFMPVIANRLIDLIPRLKNLIVRRLWRGLYPMTPDGYPIVGESEISGFFLAVGMCGQGFMMGPGIGKNLADLIAKGKPDIDEKIFESLSPKRDFYAGKVEALK